MSRKLVTKFLGVALIVGLGLMVTPIAAQTQTPPSFPLAESGSYAVGL